MIILNRGEISVVAVSATESGHHGATYTFRFVNQMNKRTVNVVAEIHPGEGKRVDFFHIDVDQFFDDEDEGEYTYDLIASYPFGQPPAVIDTGIMRLIGERSVFIQYEPSIEYVTYGG